MKRIITPNNFNPSSHRYSPDRTYLMNLMRLNRPGFMQDWSYRFINPYGEDAPDIQFTDYQPESVEYVTAMQTVEEGEQDVIEPPIQPAVNPVNQPSRVVQHPKINRRLSLGRGRPTSIFPSNYTTSTASIMTAMNMKQREANNISGTLKPIAHNFDINNKVTNPDPTSTAGSNLTKLSKVLTKKNNNTKYIGNVSKNSKKQTKTAYNTLHYKSMFI